MFTLKTELKETYSMQGYLSGIPILDETELRQARLAFAELEREFGEDYTQYSLHNVHQQYDWVMTLAKHPRLLQIVVACLGPDVLLLDSRFICKYPVGNLVRSDVGEEQEVIVEAKEEKIGLPYVAWHQDMRYWGIAGGPVLSVWLALDDSLHDNGALQVIPGTHLSGLLPHRPTSRVGNMLSVNQEIPWELVQAEKAVLCPLYAGQISIHDGLLVHASEPNTSQRRRCGFVMRYVPSCAFPIQDAERPRQFPATVVATGTDLFNHFSSSTVLPLS